MTIVERCLLGLLLTLAILGAAVAPCAAATFEDLVQQLGADDFSTKSDAAEALGRLGDGRAVAPLKALSDGRLYVGPDKRILIVAEDGTSVVDAVSQQPVTGVAVDALDKVRANNRLRGVIEASLAGLTLFSPDRDKRLAAARDALGHPSPAATAALEKALASEPDPVVRVGGPA